MEPGNAEAQLGFFRHLLRNDGTDPKELNDLLKALCRDEASQTCREARVLNDVFRGALSERYASIQLLAFAGRYEEAVAGLESLFGGRPPETSLLFAYAKLLLHIDARRDEGLSILKELAAARASLIAEEARALLREEAFETELAKALDEVYDDTTRAQSVAVLERLIAERPDDPRIERWQNAVAEGRYWLAIDRAEALLQKGRLKAAEATYREALRINPNRPFAFVGLSALAERRGRLEDATALLRDAIRAADGQSEDYRRMLSRRIDRLRLSALERQTAALAPEVDEEGAFKTRPSDAYVRSLEKEVALSEASPWTVSRLARAYWTRGEETKAEALWQRFEKTAGQSGDNANSADEALRNEFLYAEALFWRSVEAPERALALLSAFLPPENASSEGPYADGWVLLTPPDSDPNRIFTLRQMALELRETVAYNEAERLAAEGRYAEALAAFRKVSNPPAYLLARAADWAEIEGDFSTSYVLWARAGEAPEWLAESVFGRMRAVLVVDPAGARTRTVALAATLEEAAERNHTLDANLLQRIVSHLDDAGAVQEADDLLMRHTALLANTPETANENVVMLWRRVAEIYEAAGDNRKALETYEKAFAAAGFLTDEEGRRVSFTRAMRRPDAPVRSPSDPEPAALAPDGWLAVSLRNRAEELYRKEETVFRSGIDFGLDRGTKGYSDLTAVTWMNEASFPLQGGRATLRTDSVGYRMGSLGDGNQSFGTLRAWDLGDAAAGSPINSDYGQSAAFQWEGEQLSFDIGTTPMGFAYSDPVGSIEWSWDVGNFGFALSAFHRPEDSSLLAFGGQRDPNTGKTWGGVRRTGLRWSVSHDLGERDGYWAFIQAESIKGHNVADNYDVQAMAGWYRRLVSLAHRQTTVGASILYWHYDKDLSDYYWGQGGYYSPNHALSVGGFAEEARRNGDWSWVLRGRLGVSGSKSDARDRYPLKSKLRPLNLPDLDTVEESDSSVGASVQLYGAVERRLTPRAFVGAAFSYDHDTDDYNPLYVGLWFRWHFSDWDGDLALPPEPMLPYARW